MVSWDKFNTIALWMLKVGYLNLIWILFTCIGVVVFGFFPATGAMFSIVRKWYKKENDFRIFPAFWKIYKKEFFKLNGFAVLFTIVGYVLYYDFTFLQINSGKLSFLFPVLVLILIAYVITLLFFFPVYIHFELKFFQYIKQAFLIAVTSPVETLSIALSFVALYFIVTLIPGIIPLFTGNVLAVVSTWISNRAFRRIKIRKSIR
ncbi:YesL family protein [Oceanobacillus chungangensis]|uniref:DUF624 domain-containing protein n=1 Tax=Oceanobacillus chungangensis TaxID=1229152 RepID=A0A3D8PZR0_9BACI|nr:DUF624 domain-containing protein [Oceanobacillus chungangensis]RDW20649.1 hypothetical protein CWR45_05300 [Oceanobacillus chungangensis]